MSLLLHIIVTYVKENIITKLQILYSQPRNLTAGNKSPTLLVKNLFAWEIYLPRAKYSLKGLNSTIDRRLIVEISASREMCDNTEVMINWLSKQNQLMFSQRKMLLTKV